MGCRHDCGSLSHRVETLCWKVGHRWCVGCRHDHGSPSHRVETLCWKVGHRWCVGCRHDCGSLSHRVETLCWKVLYRWCIGGRRDSANGTLSANVGSNPTDIYAQVSIDRRAPTVRYQTTESRTLRINPINNVCHTQHRKASKILKILPDICVLCDVVLDY